jgi:hypothetical protein
MSVNINLSRRPAQRGQRSNDVAPHADSHYQRLAKLQTLRIDQAELWASLDGGSGLSHAVCPSPG